MFIDSEQTNERKVKAPKTKEEKDAILNKIFLKVASKTASNGFYKKNNFFVEEKRKVNNDLDDYFEAKKNNFFEDKLRVNQEFDKYFVFESYGRGKERNMDKLHNGVKGVKGFGLNENELKFVSVRKQHEEKEIKEKEIRDKEFREKILKEKEKIKKNALKSQQNFTEEIKKMSAGGPANPGKKLEKELFLFNESFNNISHISIEEKQGIDFNDKNDNDSVINLSLNLDKYEMESPLFSKVNTNRININNNNNNHNNNHNYIKNQKEKEKENENSILIEDIDAKGSNSKQQFKNSFKVEGSTKDSMPEANTFNKNKVNEHDHEVNDNDKSKDDLVCEQKFSKTGTNFFTKKLAVLLCARFIPSN